MYRRGLTLVCGWVLALALACAPAPAREHDVLDAAAQPLRERFNAAVDQVRVLMIAAPT